MNKIRNLFVKPYEYQKDHYNFNCSLGDKYIKLGKITKILDEIDISICKITNQFDPILEEIKNYHEFIGTNVYDNFKHNYDSYKKTKNTSFDLLQFIKSYDLFITNIEPINIWFPNYNINKNLENLKTHIQRYYHFIILKKRLIKLIEESNQPNIEINRQSDLDELNQTNDEEKLCKICLKNNRNCVFVHSNNTSHLICCYDCGKLIKNNNSKCPICREDIISVNIVYIS